MDHRVTLAMAPLHRPGLLRRLLRGLLRMGRPLQGQRWRAGAGHGDALGQAVARGTGSAAPGADPGGTQK